MDKLQEIKDVWSDDIIYSNFGETAKKDISWLVETIEQQQKEIEQLKRDKTELNKEIGSYSSQLFTIANENHQLTEKIKSVITKMLGGN